MPKKARKREPDEPVLATFMIAYEKWQQFQKVARAEGTTASATLVAFIESYLTGARLDDEDDEEAPEDSFTPENNRDFDERIEKALNEKLSGVDNLLNHLQNSVEKIDRRLEYVENVLPSGEENTETQSPKTIDIDAIAVEPEIEFEVQPPPPETPQPPPNWAQFSNGTNNPSPRIAGLTEKALCEEFGINPFNVHRNAQVRGISRQAYLHQLTGWLYRDGLYYPA